MSNGIAIASAIAEVHRRYIASISDVLLGEKTAQVIKDLIKSALIKMAEVEAGALKDLDDDDIKKAQQRFASAAPASSVAIYARQNRTLGFPDPSDTRDPSGEPQQHAVPDQSEAAVFGLFLYSYKCCHSD